MLRPRQPIQPFVHDNINRFMHFLQQRHLQCILLRIRSYNYVYLIIILTQEEEYNQCFHQLSVEFSIHFVQFIHPYMNPLPQRNTSSTILTLPKSQTIEPPGRQLFLFSQINHLEVKRSFSRKVIKILQMMLNYVKCLTRIFQTLWPA